MNKQKEIRKIVSTDIEVREIEENENLIINKRVIETNIYRISINIYRHL